jgi:hypothetical protein
MIVLDSQFHIVANAAAKGAGGVFDDFDWRAHEHIPEL